MVAERAVLGGSIDAKTALQRAVPKVPITIIVSLVTSIIVGLGLILFVIPGIYLSVNFAFILQAIALRNCGFNALQYSRNLVKGQLWKVFGRLVTIGFGFLILFLVIGFILGFAVAVVSAFPIVQVILNIILSLIFGLTGYLMSVVFTMFFLNLDYLKNAPEGST
ncbi:hypothetical protein [Baaleninema sp.]|uniref:hypothetical protein n=1 Tax=Baaleninema sp. TaxID=3101197 RepID=UPI003D073030